MKAGTSSTSNIDSMDGFDLRDKAKMLRVVVVFVKAYVKASSRSISTLKPVDEGAVDEDAVGHNANLSAKRRTRPLIVWSSPESWSSQIKDCRACSADSLRYDVMKFSAARRAFSFSTEAARV